MSKKKYSAGSVNKEEKELNEVLLEPQEIKENEEVILEIQEVTETQEVIDKEDVVSEKVETISQETEPSEPKQETVVTIYKKGRVISIAKNTVTLLLEDGKQSVIKRPDYKIKLGEIIDATV